MRYLGIDLGTKRVGLAISDRTNTIANKLKVIHYSQDLYEQMLDEIVSIIEENKITDVVLGFPKNMNNSLGEAALRSLKFKNDLQNKKDINIILMDERLTTTIAQDVLISADVSRKKRKKVIDSLAATIILNDYLKMKRG